MIVDSLRMETRIRLEPDTATWKTQAACRGLATDLFYPRRGIYATQALKVCESCPVKQECLEYALRNGETIGVWGGTTEIMRRAIRKKRRGTRLEVSRFSLRRQKVLSCMWKQSENGFYTGTLTQIADALGIPAKTVTSDVKWLRQQEAIAVVAPRSVNRSWKLLARQILPVTEHRHG